MTNKKIELSATVPEHYAGYRLDKALACLFPEHSRSRIKMWVEKNQVTVNGTQLKPKDKLKGGEKIVIDAALERQATWEAEAIPLNIIHEDDAILVINKPAGLVVHPGAGNPSRTLVNALLHYAEQLALLPRAGLIHRLDKDTSGLLLIAKTLSAYTDLTKKLQNREISRHYQAIVQGRCISGGTINEPIGRHPTQRTRMAVLKSNHTAKPAVTHFRVLEKFSDYTHLHVQLETGRTHQIRVHMAHILHPIVGDPVYAKRLQLPKGCPDALEIQLKALKRQALHAKKLTFLHPASNQSCSFESVLSEDLQALLHCLRENNAIEINS